MRYISVNVRDKVIVAPVLNRNKPCKAEILEVKKRYGRVSNGKIPVSPLVTVRFLDNGQQETFDNSFVQSVVERSTKPQPRVNVFADALKGSAGRMGFNFWVEVKGSTWVGYPQHLGELALSKLPYNLEHDLNTKQLRKLYRKDGRPGFLGYAADGIYRVNKYRFMEWVRKNYNRICFTKGELDAQATATNQEYEREYWQSVDAQMEREMLEEEDIFDQYDDVSPTF